MKTAIIRKNGNLEIRITYIENQDSWDKLRIAIVSRSFHKRDSYRGTEARDQLEKWKQDLNDLEDDEELVVNEFGGEQ